MGKKKYYAALIGTATEIFTDWTSCERAVKGVAGAKYKGFFTRKEAEEWLKNPQYSFTNREEKKHKKVLLETLSSDENNISIFTDGGCINNPGPGGYGIVIIEGNTTEELSGGFRYTTNNRMEMMAAIVALKKIITRAQVLKPIILHSDSKYMINGLEKGWAKAWRSHGWKKSNGEAALNIDLWDELLKCTEQSTIKFCWVKGHAGYVFNERCDKLAVAAARNNPSAIDFGYEGQKKEKEK